MNKKVGFRLSSFESLVLPVSRTCIKNKKKEGPSVIPFEPMSFWMFLTGNIEIPYRAYRRGSTKSGNAWHTHCGALSQKNTVGIVGPARGSGRPILWRSGKSVEARCCCTHHCQPRQAREARQANTAEQNSQATNQTESRIRQNIYMATLLSTSSPTYDRESGLNQALQ